MSTDAEQIIDLYRRHGALWASKRAAAGATPMEAPWLDRFLVLLPKRAAILDIGCGSAEPIGRYLIGRGHDVTGIDSSPELIEICRAQSPGGDWRVADMRGLSLDRRFDGLLAWDSFFHLTADDQRRMFEVFAAHAAPRAALLFTTGPAAGVAIGDMAGEPLYHASLDPDDYRRLLRDAGFDVIAHVIEDPRCGRHTVWLAQAR